MSSQTVLLRTTLTRTIVLYLIMILLLGSNRLPYMERNCTFCPWKRVPNRVFGIRDLAFLEPGIRDSKGIWERGSRNRHFEAPRSGISDGEKLKTQLSPSPTTETTGNLSWAFSTTQTRAFRDPYGVLFVLKFCGNKIRLHMTFVTCNHITFNFYKSVSFML